MKVADTPLVLRHDDYEILVSYLRVWKTTNSFDRKCVDDLNAELKKAMLVSPEDFPSDVVRLFSRVKIKEAKKDKPIELTLVTPDKANIKEKLISVMAPIGTALIGFRKGQVINWNVPAGSKTFTILEVENLA